MSRSKEGRDATPGMNDEVNETGSEQRSNLDRRLGAKGQTDYTPGRESSREFPRRSTSMRGRHENEQGGRAQTRPEYGQRVRNLYENDYRGEGRYEGRYGRTEGYGNRGTNREDMGDVYSRSMEEPVSQRGQGTTGNRYGSYAQREAGREGYGRYGDRDEYRSRENYQSSYQDEPDRYGRGVRANRELGYSTFDRDNRSERYGNYDRDYETNRSEVNRGYGRHSEEHDYREERYRGSSGRPSLRCGDIMTKDITVCHPQTTLREVAEKLDDENVGSLPVVENGRLVGIITDRDIVCRVIAEGREARAATASEAMSEDLVTITAEESLYSAIEKLGEHQIRRLPVVDLNGRLRGMLSLADIALEAEADRELADAVEKISQPTPNKARKV